MRQHRETEAAGTHLAQAAQQIQAGLLDEAILTLGSILADAPHDPTALGLLSTAKLRAGRAREATELARRAVALAPDDPSALAALASATAAIGETAAAITVWRRAIARAPGLAAAHCNLGLLLLSRKAASEAFAACNKALDLDPSLAAARLNRGLAAINLGRLEEGEADLLAVQPAMRDNVDLWVGLGVTRRRMGRHGEATAALEQAIHLDPRHAGAVNNLGRVHRATGAYDQAIACFDRALELCPDFEDARWNRAVSNLLAGRLAGAWEDHEARWRLPGMDPHPSYPAPVWQGGPIKGRTILLSPEQGLGDAIQFARYAPMLAARGARVVLGIRPELKQVMRSLDGVAALVTPGDPLPPIDCFCPLMSLPRAFRTELQSIPATVPYLRAEPSTVIRWQRALSSKPGLSVGVVWAGNPKHANDHNRSLSLPALAGLAAVPGVRLFSLQVGPRAVEAAAWPALTDLSPHLTDFAETAAALSVLDLLVTVDTSIAHLAGALARPVWIMLAHEPDWRWMAGRDDSPWYPTARLFRQKRFGDWSGPVGEIKAALAKLARRPAATPVLA